MFGARSGQQLGGPYSNFPGLLGGQYASSMSAPSMSSSIQEIIDVPPDLASFAGNPQFFSILLKVKEQSGVISISVRRDLDDNTKGKAVEISAASGDNALIARKLVETHFKNQLKLNQKSQNLMKVHEEVGRQQEGMASGTVAEFVIHVDLVGLAIGKQGKRIKEIEAETGCKASVAGHSGRVVLSGSTTQAVQQAKALLDLKEKRYPLKPEQYNYLSNRPYEGTLGNVRDQCGLLVARVDREDLVVVGPQTSITLCDVLLPTNLEYVDKQIAMEGEEREAYDQLRGLRKQFGGYGERGERGEGGGYGGRGGGYGGRGGGYGGRGGGESRGEPRSGGRSSASAPRGPPGAGDARKAPGGPPVSDKPARGGKPTGDAAVATTATALARATLADSGMLPEKKPRERGPKVPAAPAAAPAAPAPAPAAAPAAAPADESTRKRGAKPKKERSETNKEGTGAAAPATTSPREPKSAAAKPAAAAAVAAAPAAAGAAPETAAQEKRVRKPREKKEKPEGDAAPKDAAASTSESKGTRLVISEGRSSLRSHCVSHFLLSFFRLFPHQP